MYREVKQLAVKEHDRRSQSLACDGNLINALYVLSRGCQRNLSIDKFYYFFFITANFPIIEPNRKPDTEGACYVIPRFLRIFYKVCELRNKNRNFFPMLLTNGAF